MKLRVAGTELSYDAGGEGPPLLFLHAFPLGLSMWDPQAAALRSRFTVIRFDDRGFGGTPPGDALLTMERIAEDGVALLDHLGVSRAVVCGLSMGGYAAFAMVRRFAERISGLVLADTRAGADTPEARKGRGELATRVLREGPSAIVDAFLPKLIGPTTVKERPAVVDTLRSIMMAASTKGIADALAGLAARADSVPTLKEIRVPTLVICGEEDTTTPPPDSRAIHEGVRGSKLVILPRSGHISNLETPDAFNAAVIEFAEALPAPAAS